MLGEGTEYYRVYDVSFLHQDDDEMKQVKFVIFCLEPKIQKALISFWPSLKKQPPLLAVHAWQNRGYPVPCLCPFPFVRVVSWGLRDPFELSFVSEIAGLYLLGTHQSTFYVISIDTHRTHR